MKDARDHWIRQLLGDGVTCFLASKDKPSWPGPGRNPANRLLAGSVRKVFDNEANSLTFDQFAKGVRKEATRDVGDKNMDPDYLNYFVSPKIGLGGLFITNRPPKR